MLKRLIRLGNPFRDPLRRRSGRLFSEGLTSPSWVRVDADSLSHFEVSLEKHEIEYFLIMGTLVDPETCLHQFNQSLFLSKRNWIFEVENFCDGNNQEVGERILGDQIERVFKGGNSKF